MSLRTALLALAALTLAGCTRTVTVTALRPAAVEEAGKTRQLAVYTLKNDTVGLTEKIEADASAVRVEGEPWFQVTSRSDMARLFEEMRLQESGLAQESRALKAGELLGATAIVTGAVTTAEVGDDHYTAERYECLDKKCKQMRKYRIACTRRTATLAAQVKVVDVERGTVLYGDTFKRTRSWNHCRDRSGGLPTRGEALEGLADAVASDFVARLTPGYERFSVELMDDPDIEYTDHEERLLENALAYVDHGRFDRAKALLGELLRRTGERSVTAAYDLGVLEEATG
ncbi:CsgG/HfaB family protein, partial [Hydrogenimonas sp.]